MSDPVLATVPLGFPWQTLDPFLFCVHHLDRYPAGNEQMGPQASLEGRNIGMDFTIKDGWRMYHGDVVPGFPRHPHRGFETVTVARQGYIDHSDSLGARARFGNGDVQWMTAGRGVEHCEMFPLVRRDAGNPTELFQIWLNLPKASKMVAPYFTMLWSESIPSRTYTDSGGHDTHVKVHAGQLDGMVGAAPPPDSWATRPEARVGIWTLRMDPGARWRLPPAPGTNRVIYFFEGETLGFDRRQVPVGQAIQLEPSAPVELANGNQPGQALVLQGCPIGEPVVQHGPFVMNTRAEIQQAYADYQTTRFGRWPWSSADPVHPRDEGRFAQHADGRTERPG